MRPASVAGRGRKGVAVSTLGTVRPQVVWALDFQFVQTHAARTFHLINVVDERTQKCPAIAVECLIDADDVVACLHGMAKERGAHAYLRFDHGPEFIADRCRLNDGGTVLIDPGCPWQNAWVETSTATH
jgi:putative transposase